jgi:hypothetical protein
MACLVMVTSRINTQIFIEVNNNTNTKKNVRVNKPDKLFILNFRRILIVVSFLPLP